MDTGRIAILGGGICGLYLGHGLRQRGIPFTLFEAEDVAGGLCRTLRSGPFHWDLGVHALYSKDARFGKLLASLPLGYQDCRRRVRICHPVDGAIHELDYPFENGLHQLPDADWEDCVVGYMEACAAPRRAFANLEEWIRLGLGSGIARCFMTPYNRKIWNCPLDRISLDLVANKIEPEPFEKILRGALGRPDVGRAYQARFVYPRGGIQEFVDHFHAAIAERVRLGKTLVAVVPRDGGHRLEFADGSRENCDILISTIPLTSLIDALPYPELRARRPAFRANNTLFVMVGLKDGRSFDRFGDCHWTFFANDEIFYRTTFMHNFSDRFPAAVVAEYTVKDGETVAAEDVGRRVVADLLRRRVLRDRRDIHSLATHFQTNTYPIPTVGLAATKRQTAAFLADRNIHLVGRNGAWNYVNIDGVLAAADAFLEAFVPALAAGRPLSAAERP